MNENNTRLIQFLAAANPPPPTHLPFLILSDPIALVAREMTIPKKAIVWDEREEVDANRQVLPDVKEARFHRNPTKLQERRARRLGGEDLLAKVIKPGDEICPLLKRSEIWMPASTPSTLGQALQQQWMF
ncbi:hypothetical protein Acr_14g0004730 [Actinidia rufa]|uniref:Uncharacterized protein n=1 Tax=Actinidia rufa TaxID=165716 RepID=A0A7J0FSB4_9ERIC|nr:hypothetical protein Acr_14g0004730 [Actinidia rufa]